MAAKPFFRVKTDYALSALGNYSLDKAKYHRMCVKVKLRAKLFEKQSSTKFENHKKRSY